MRGLWTLSMFKCRQKARENEEALLLIAFTYATFSALQQTHCARVACDSEGVTVVFSQGTEIEAVCLLRCLAVTQLKLMLSLRIDAFRCCLGARSAVHHFTVPDFMRSQIVRRRTRSIVSSRKHFVLTPFPLPTRA